MSESSDRGAEELEAAPSATVTTEASEPKTPQAASEPPAAAEAAEVAEIAEALADDEVVSAPPASAPPPPPALAEAESVTELEASDAVLAEDTAIDAVVPPARVENAPVDDEVAAAEAAAANAEELGPDEVEEAPPAPRILSIEPAHGPATRTTVITVTGEAFAEGCLVRVGSEDLHPHAWSETSFELSLPTRDEGGYVDIRVVNPDQQNELRVNAFHYDPPPRIDRIEPDFASPDGGASILVLGRDFGEGCLVLLGDVELPVFPQGEGKLEIVVPPRDSGQFDIVVKNPDGQTDTLEKALCFADPPVVTGIDPVRGSIAGGAEVTVEGKSFMPGVGVEVAGEPVATVTYEGPTRLRFITPAHADVALVDVAVVNPTGLRHRLPKAFSYRLPAPVLSQVSPKFGPNSGGTRLTLDGSDLSEGCRVLVCGIEVKVDWKSANELEVTSPEVSRSGLCAIQVVNPDDQSVVLDKAYRYDAPLAAPVLTAVGPAVGPAAGGIEVTLIGENFTDQSVVRFGVVTAKVQFLTHKELRATCPPGAGLVPVEVVNPDGALATLYEAFTYEAPPAPTITGITPVFGPSIGGTKVVIEGTNFNASCTVYLGREYPKDTVIKSATEIVIITAPRKAAGVVDVEVAAPGVPKAVMKNGFRYDAVPAPTIASVSPNRGAVAGGTELSITGANFLKETVVLVDGKPVKAKYVDKANLELKMPGGTDGKLVDVAVRNPDGKEAVQKRAFQYDARYR